MKSISWIVSYCVLSDHYITSFFKFSLQNKLFTPMSLFGSFLSVLCPVCCPSASSDALHPSLNICSDSVVLCICLWSVFPGRPFPEAPCNRTAGSGGAIVPVRMPGSALLCFPAQICMGTPHPHFIPQNPQPVDLSVVSQQAAVVAVWLSVQSSWSVSGQSCRKAYLNSSFNHPHVVLFN